MLAVWLNGACLGVLQRTGAAGWRRPADPGGRPADAAATAPADAATATTTVVLPAAIRSAAPTTTHAAAATASAAPAVLQPAAVLPRPLPDDDEPAADADAFPEPLTAPARPPLRPIAQQLQQPRSRSARQQQRVHFQWRPLRPRTLTCTAHNSYR